MTSSTHHTVRLFTSHALRSAAVLGVLAGAALFGAGQAPALAQSTSWEEGCAMRVVSPGSGDFLRTSNCSRQKDCQQMANAQGSMLTANGCFFVMPDAAPSAQAGQARPARKQ